MADDVTRVGTGEGTDQGSRIQSGKAKLVKVKHRGRELLDRARARLHSTEK